MKDSIKIKEFDFNILEKEKKNEKMNIFVFKVTTEGAVSKEHMSYLKM